MPNNACTKGEMLFRRGGMARIEPVGSVFHLGIRVSRVAQMHNVKIGLSNGDSYMRRDVRGGGGGGRGTANKDVHFVVTKRTADDFSLLSYTLLSWDCICLPVQYSIM
jgi:hypothetical protein